MAFESGSGGRGGGPRADAANVDAVAGGAGIGGGAGSGGSAGSGTAGNGGDAGSYADGGDADKGAGDAPSIEGSLDASCGVCPPTMPMCVAGACALPPSCAALGNTCGPNRDQVCCTSNVVPGGSFNRGNNPGAPAKVSPFRLDVYEVTVARFRTFFAGYPANLPDAGAGRNPNDPMDTGWNASWSSRMPADTAALGRALRSAGNLDTWTDAPGDNESRAVNGLSWYEAYAFCIWDGGRLPTEAEWNFAAAGGDEQREYPFPLAVGQHVDRTYASFWEGDCNGDDQPGCTFADVLIVGSRSPKGDGRWGHADLAGNVAEWVVDEKGLYPLPCVDCANRADRESERVNRGASFQLESIGNRERQYPGIADGHWQSAGARCARSY
jgi:formylglycine-generating enzyme required for sulfatase activity